MTTVTAKQLRQNLSSYLDRMAAGEEFAVIRRSTIIGQLKPVKAAKKQGNGPAILAAIDQYRKHLKDNNVSFDIDQGKSTTELYHKALDEKYGLK